MQTFHEAKPLRELKPHPDNPRDGDIGTIVESIRHNGWFGAIAYQKSTRHIIIGNHRAQAAEHCGIVEVPAFEIDCDDATALRILLADNRTSDLASNKPDELAGILASLATTSTLDGTGYDTSDLDDLISDMGASELPALPTEKAATVCPSCGHTWTAA